MGYELTRFIGEVDEEFLCSICTSVLEDPVQSPCEHSFCSTCIKDWLSITKSCPADRTPLTISDIRPANRPFRNLWNKLDINCDFQPLGCSATIKLQDLEIHVGSCEYNLNSEIVCDKGCNLTITRREYKINCLSHLGKEITKLTHELRDQKQYFARIVNGQQDEIKKLNDEGSRQRSQLEHFESAISRLQQLAGELTDKSNISFRSLKLRKCLNMKIEGSNILKVDNPSAGIGLVESEYPLEPGKSYFRLHMLGIVGEIGIGLKNVVQNWIIRCSNDRLIYTDVGFHVAPKSKVGDILECGIKFPDSFHVAPKSKVGDILECGIKFPDSFIDDGNHNATVYLSRNDELFFEKSLTIPKNGLFPAIDIHGKDTRLQYFQ